VKQVATHISVSKKRSNDTLRDFRHNIPFLERIKEIVVITINIVIFNVNYKVKVIITRHMVIILFWITIMAYIIRIAFGTVIMGPALTICYFRPQSVVLPLSLDTFFRIEVL